MFKQIVLCGALMWMTVMVRAGGDGSNSVPRRIWAALPSRVWSAFVPDECTIKHAGVCGFLRHFETYLQTEVDGEIQVYVDLEVLTTLVMRADDRNLRQVQPKDEKGPPIIEYDRSLSYGTYLDWFCAVVDADWKREGKRFIIFRRINRQTLPRPSS